MNPFTFDDNRERRRPAGHQYPLVFHLAAWAIVIPVILAIAYVAIAVILFISKPTPKLTEPDPIYPEPRETRRHAK